MASAGVSADLQSLLQQHLKRSTVRFLPLLTFDYVQKAIAACGVGLDHTIGEGVLAIGDYSMNKDLVIFFMLTDRRVAGRRGRIFFHAPLAEITQVVDKTNLITANLKIHTSNSIEDATIGNLSKPLGNFLSAVCQFPPPSRTPPPRGFPSPVADQLDENWLASQRAYLSEPCQQMLSVSMQKVRNGEIQFEAGKNFFSRIFLQSRNEQYGRGMLNGWWMSPLPISDLVEVCRWLLGDPVQTNQNQNLLTLDFATGAARGTGKALASSAVGLAAAGLIGFGWYSLPGKAPAKYVRITLSGAPGMTYFNVQGVVTTNLEPLSAIQPTLLEKLFQSLTHCEQLLLSQRVIYGWSEDAATLMNKK